MTPGEEATGLRVASAGSRLVGGIDRALEALSREWTSSAVRRHLQTAGAILGAAPATERVRLAGVTVLSAALTHVALVIIAGETVGWPTWIARGAALAVGVSLVAWPRALAEAWTERRPWVRRLFGGVQQ